MNETTSTLCLVAMGMILGGLITSTICDRLAEKEAIKHNAAHYDAKTGAFTWNDEVKK